MHPVSINFYLGLVEVEIHEQEDQTFLFTFWLKMKLLQFV